MSRDTIFPDKIALLATGDEIINGDILNTNSQEIALRLINQGMNIGTHMVTSDNIQEIEEAILFLLKAHRALIITGGLGPTSDDLTRFALSKAINKNLIFDESTWENICERLRKFGYATPPESNRQQALFPEEATIIPNPNGTAAGCQFQFGEQWIFMLPGPPPECLPMIASTVLPILKQAGFQHILFRRNWLLFGVSEGQIAEELDNIAKPFGCTTGYRIFYPYIEFKIYSSDEKKFLELIPLIEKVVSPYLISDGRITASATLQKTLINLPFVLSIQDFATGGNLEAAIKTPENQAKIKFSDTPEENHIVIRGLDDFWNNNTEAKETKLSITFHQNRVEATIPFRGARVKLYAVEFLAFQINKYLSS